MAADKETVVLGIESSCDETAAAVVADGRRVLSNVVASQIELHTRFGGVVPEIAARHHLEAILPVVEAALKAAGAALPEIDLVAVTAGPGLVGTLLVGLSVAKALAFALDRPLIGVNHLHGHVYANWLLPSLPQFPLVCLVVSGGHTDLILMTGHGRMELLGRTRDDAAGEAFDKVARMLGLPYPGGPHLERLAAAGNQMAVPPLPRAWLPGTYEFSFSGLKTAVRNRLQEHDSHAPADIAAAFQAAVVDVLATKTLQAAVDYRVKQVLIAGGVAANGELRRSFELRALPLGIQVAYPPPILCTDNAAMIAAAGYYDWSSAGRGHGYDLTADPNLGILA